MSKTKSPRRGRGPAEQAPADEVHNNQGTRETVESIVIAVILAFLFRAFVAEAFVIPTGSMAPTLYGRNRDVTCAQCGNHYATGASMETEGAIVVQTNCPICRFRMDLDPNGNANHRSFNGDRILVSKFSYALFEPRRWDIIVFKYPLNAKQNFIKRLIGLPDEALRLFHGDVFFAKRMFTCNIPNDEYDLDAWRTEFNRHGIELSAAAELLDVNAGLLMADGEREYLIGPNGGVYANRFQIARKPPHKMLAMLQTVHDTDHLAPSMVSAGWPSRWQDWSGLDSWKVADQGSRFATTGEQDQISWLRYRHLIPTQTDWNTVERTGKAPADVHRRQGRLIGDYYAYNDCTYSSVSDTRHREPSHWVGDLAVECDVEVRGGQGALLLDLVEGGAHYRCRIDVTNGQAELSIINGERGFSAPDGASATLPRAATAIRGPGTYQLRFSNIDDELRLWVNGSLVTFDGPTTYIAREDVRPSFTPLDPGDAEPVGIGSEGLAMEVNRLRVLRDIYYVATNGADTDYDGSSFADIVEVFSDPSSWATTSLFESRQEVMFYLAEDQFFPCGDNSPASKDARLWGPPAYVERKLLIGKAVLIYWPHAWNRPVPFFPNIGRMKLIR